MVEAASSLAFLGLGWRGEVRLWIVEWDGIGVSGSRIVSQLARMISR